MSDGIIDGIIWVIVTITQFNPDPREYQQQRTVGTLEQRVAVAVPNTPEYVVFVDDNGAVLTPKGWAYVVEELEKPFKEVQKGTKDESEDWDDEDWEDLDE
ncbi:hypothetical protein D6833_08270 [Candidatus Parcubacteria bacterium]|nr:MAG: hypothetical protein D6833_08270 [Candidatus Parcubacteria bacterium]